MKKILSIIFVIMILPQAVVSENIFDDPIVEEIDDFYGKVVQFPKDGKLYFIDQSERDANGHDLFKIYDDNLNLVTSFYTGKWYSPNLYYISSNGIFVKGTDYSILTQHLFNNDDKIEWIEIAPFENEIGFNIMQEDDGYGKCIASVRLEENLYINDEIQIITDTHGSAFLILKVKDKNDNRYKYYYKINRDASSVPVMTLIKKSETKAYPNPVKRGEPLDVEYDKVADADIIVSNVNGMQVARTKLTDGRGTIETGSLTEGMYIYTIQSATKTHASGKFIVK